MAESTDTAQQLSEKGSDASSDYNEIIDVEEDYDDLVIANPSAIYDTIGQNFFPVVGVMHRLCGI